MNYVTIPTGTSYYGVLTLVATLWKVELTLYQPMTVFAVMVSHQPIQIYMGV